MHRERDGAHRAGPRRRPLAGAPALNHEGQAAVKVRHPRAQRTRTRLQDALVALMLEKGYEATVVQDILDRSAVSRSTFYRHFADKEALLASLVEDLGAFLTRQQRQARAARGARAHGLSFSVAMLEHARDHLALYHALLGRDSNALIPKRMHRTVADLARNDIKSLGFNGTPAQRELAAEYVAGAFIAVLTWWLERGARVSPQVVDLIFSRLVMRGLAGDVVRPQDAGDGRDRSEWSSP